MPCEVLRGVHGTRDTFIVLLRVEVCKDRLSLTLEPIQAFNQCLSHRAQVGAGSFTHDTSIVG